MASLLPAFQSLPLPIVQLSLAAVLKCGQSFRWAILDVGEDTEYRLCLRDRVVCLRQSPTTLFYRALYPDPQPTPTQKALRDAETLVWLNDYFQLDVDLVGLYNEWSTRDPVFARMQSRFEGIRILRQDPWENLISFICSSNNNISRITKMVQALCTEYSPPLLTYEGEKYHPFPPPSVLAQPGVSATLRSLGFGYRAEFINRTAKMLADTHGRMPLPNDTFEASERWLMSLRNSRTDDAREELLKFVGVGRKVADCVLLMSLDKKEVVPVDTHVHQIAVKHYGLKDASGPSGKKATMTPKIYGDVNTKLFRVWGDYAGWAHSVLFTADLKSFASYGLPAPGSRTTSPSSTKIAPDFMPGDILPTPPLTPVSSLKRSNDPVHCSSDCQEAATLAERVKRRRRGA
ncbi:putative N-glycosylase dna lyase [Lyophyllum shimeji]|uniref:DNA-(apurinic or apyrimidinic site) lyase n=1 Tax=Lyophyllum shimeji TaxID=47721 RepID=A0A9P3PG70_LYOSH|nr:putative N-glycosylase dna lyase [Lyophyllum shimeji]